MTCEILDLNSLHSVDRTNTGEEPLLI